MKYKLLILTSWLVILFLTVIINPKTSYAIENIFNESWNSTSNLYLNISNLSTYLHNNKIFTVGGSSSVDFNLITFSNVLANGHLDSWQPTINFPEEIYYHQLVAVGEHYYVLGGNNYPPPTSTSRVYFGKPDDNSVINWSLTTPLPNARAEGGAISIKNRIYYLGGMYQVDSNSEPISNDVYFTNVNTDGTLSGWNTTTPLNTAQGQPVYFIGVAETGNKILTVAGKHNQNNRFSRAVFQSEVNPTTGELGLWEETHSLPDNGGLYQGYNSVGTIRVGNYVIAVGGNVPAVGGVRTQSNKVYYTSINSDGSVNPWEVSQFNLPIHSGEGSLEYANGYLYYMGGYSTELGGYHNKVFFTKLDIPNETSEAILNVPDLKQYSLPWGPLTYDHQTIKPPTMARWGCATTSAAMILQYYGSSVTPEGLNEWLKQNNGYDRRGHNILWSSVSAFAKQDPNTPNLEFRYYDFSESFLKTEIENNRPAIVKVQNLPYKGVHFVTAKGFNGSDVFINDPAKTTHPTLSDANAYWGGNISIGKFMPSNTDLSYIVLFFDENINLKILDPLGNEIGAEYFHTEYPSLDPDNPEIAPEGEVLKSFYFPKPQSGNYTVEISGNGSYQLDSYLYNENGESAFSTAKGISENNVTKTVYISFDKQSESKIIDDSVLDLYELISNYDKSLIFKRGVFNHIKNATLNINNQILNRNDKIALSLINLLRSYVEENKNTEIENEYYQQIVNELNNLYNQILIESTSSI